jgi:hypothetical protein
MDMSRASADPAEVTLSIEVTCHHCRRHPTRDAVMDVFVEMEPGVDGTSWMICAKCWLAYLRNEGRLTAIGGRVLELPVATKAKITKPASRPAKPQVNRKGSSAS